MTRLLSPGERNLLDTLPPNEAELIRAFIDELDAHLLPEHEPARATKRGETEQARMRYDARVEARRRFYDQQQLRPPLEFEL